MRKPNVEIIVRFNQNQWLATFEEIITFVEEPIKYKINNVCKECMQHEYNKCLAVSFFENHFARC